MATTPKYIKRQNTCIVEVCICWCFQRFIS